MIAISQLLHASRVTFVVPSCLKVQHRASCQLRTGSSSSPASCAPVLLCSQALPQPQMWLGGVAPTTAWSHLLRSCSRGCLPAPEPEIGAAAETLHVQSRTAREPMQRLTCVPNFIRWSWPTTTTARSHRTRPSCRRPPPPPWQSLPNFCRGGRRAPTHEIGKTLVIARRL